MLSYFLLLVFSLGKWNTGVWPAWGYGKEVTLNWAAAGVKIKKQCPVECEIVHETTGYDSDADAIAMELTNHPKFGLDSKTPIAWPEKAKENPRYRHTKKVEGKELSSTLPLTALFYYEPAQNYRGYTLEDDQIKSKIDISMTPSLRSSLPVTLICPWGREVKNFLQPPPEKTADRLIAYFNEHGVAQQFRKIVNELFDVAGERMHRFGPHMRNRESPPEAGIIFIINYSSLFYFSSALRMY